MGSSSVCVRQFSASCAPAPLQTKSHEQAKYISFCPHFIPWQNFLNFHFWNKIPLNMKPKKLFSSFQGPFMLYIRGPAWIFCISQFHIGTLHIIVSLHILHFGSAYHNRKHEIWYSLALHWWQENQQTKTLPSHPSEKLPSHFPGGRPAIFTISHFY